MIISFRDRDTKDLFEQRHVKRFTAMESVALRKLAQLHAAGSLDFLRIPPGNRLELLSGDRAGLYSIRINAQWRLCFAWAGGNATQVEIVDYH